MSFASNLKDKIVPYFGETFTEGAALQTEIETYLYKDEATSEYGAYQVSGSLSGSNSFTATLASASITSLVEGVVLTVLGTNVTNGVFSDLASGLEELRTKFETDVITAIDAGSIVDVVENGVSIGTVAGGTDYAIALKRNIQIKINTLLRYIFNVWRTVLAAASNATDFFTETLMNDLKVELLDKLSVTGANSVFKYIDAQDQAAMIQKIMGIIPSDGTSDYISAFMAVRVLQAIGNLARPSVLYTQLDDPTQSIYYKLSVDQPAGVEDFFKYYYDALLRAYVAMFRKDVLVPVGYTGDGTDGVHKPELELSTAVAYDLDVGVKTDGKWFMAGSSAQFVGGVSDLHDNMDAFVIDMCLLTINNSDPNSVAMIQTVTSLSNITQNDTKQIFQSDFILFGGASGSLYLNSVLVGSQCLLWEIMADGVESLYEVDTAVTRAKWLQLVEVYTNDTTISIEALENYENYSDAVTTSALDVMAEIYNGMIAVFTIYTTNATSTILSALGGSVSEANKIDRCKIFLSRFHLGYVDSTQTLETGFNADLSLVGTAPSVISSPIAGGNTGDELRGVRRYYHDILLQYFLTEHETLIGGDLRSLMSSVAGDSGKGIAESLFYRYSISNEFGENMKILNEIYGGVNTSKELAPALPATFVGVVAHNGAALDALKAVTVEDTLANIYLFANDKVRSAIFTGDEDPSSGRATLEITLESSYNNAVDALHFYEPYLYRFSDRDAAVLLGVIIQKDSEFVISATTNPAKGREYLDDMFGYLNDLVGDKKINETTAVYSGIKTDRSFTADGSTRRVMEDVNIVGDEIEVRITPAVTIFKEDVLCAINAEEVRYKFGTQDGNRDISDLLNSFDSAITNVQDQINSMTNNMAAIENVIAMLNAGMNLTGTDGDLLVAQAHREKAALEAEQTYMNNLLAIVTVLDSKIAVLISKQESLDAQIASYRSVYAQVAAKLADLHRIYSALPAGYDNFAQLAAALSATLKAALDKRDNVAGRISKLKAKIEAARQGYLVQSQYKVSVISTLGPLSKGDHVPSYSQINIFTA